MKFAVRRHSRLNLSRKTDFRKLKPLKTAQLLVYYLVKMRNFINLKTHDIGRTVVSGELVALGSPGMQRGGNVAHRECSRGGSAVVAHCRGMLIERSRDPVLATSKYFHTQTRSANTRSKNDHLLGPNLTPRLSKGTHTRVRYCCHWRVVSVNTIHFKFAIYSPFFKMTKNDLE